jgi:hypothetical protein
VGGVFQAVAVGILQGVHFARVIGYIYQIVRPSNHLDGVPYGDALLDRQFHDGIAPENTYVGDLVLFEDGAFRLPVDGLSFERAEPWE